MSEYTREVLKVVVAKICQTIGWHSIQSTPLEIMVDILRRYLSELTKLTHAYSIQFGHTDPNLDELGLAFRDMHINIADLEEYVRYVDSVAPIEVPQYPVRKESHLNFLKPGSSEVVTRPVHIHEHLPPMLPEVEGKSEFELCPVIKQEETQSPPNSDAGQTVFKRPADISPNENASKRPRLVLEEEGRPTREISSVMMTTSGFLSPAREGKLPEARTPVNTLDSPTTIGHPAGSASEPRFERKGPKVVKEFKKIDKRKDKTSKELFKPLPDDVSTKKFQTMKDVVKLKAIKANVASSNNTSTAVLPEPPPPSKVPNVKPPATMKQIKNQQKAVKTEKPFPPVPAPVVPKPTVPPPAEKVVEGKLSSEPDKSKLNIFKKISKVKDDKTEKVEKIKVKEDPKAGEAISLESRESSPDLVIDESELKNWEQTKIAAAAAKVVDIPPKPELPKVVPPVDVGNKIYDMTKSPHSEKDFLYDDDLSPPGTPSTPKTPEMPSHSPPLKVEKEIKKKRKDKSKVKNKVKVPKYSVSPRRNKCDNFEAELDRPKTPDDPLNLVKEEPVTVPSQPSVPLFPFPFQGYIPGPGLIPAPLFPRLPISAGLPKHGFGQPAHIPPAMPALSFVPPVRPPLEEVIEKPPPVIPPEQIAKPEKQETPNTKEKHKKDKKDKPKKKNKKDKIKNKSEKRKLKDEKKEKDKEKIKKEKKDKKKEKEREQHEGSVPKLTLKIGSPRPPTPDVQVQRKIMIKPVVKKEEEPVPSTSTSAAVEAQEKREPSPELARISALVTRPPKLKTSTATVIDKFSRHSVHAHDSLAPNVQTKFKKNVFRAVPKIKSREFKRAGEPEADVTDTPTDVHTHVTTKDPPVAYYVDNDGNKIWICPACGRQDDGTPMIGCDDCDAWYHWVCVGIQVPPDDSEDWYCRICIVKKQETLQMDKKKKRKKKERKDH